MKKLKDIELEDVYKMSADELDELEALVKVEMSRLSDKFKVTVDNACSAIESLLTNYKKKF